MHMNASQVTAIMGMNLATRLFVELRRAMLSTCEYSRLHQSPRLSVEPERGEATGILGWETAHLLAQKQETMLHPQNYCLYAVDS